MCETRFPQSGLTAPGQRGSTGTQRASRVGTCWPWEANEVLAQPRGGGRAPGSGELQKMAAGLLPFLPLALYYENVKKYSVSWKDFTMNTHIPAPYILPSYIIKD